MLSPSVTFYEGNPPATKGSTPYTIDVVFILSIAKAVSLTISLQICFIDDFISKIIKQESMGNMEKT